MKSLGCFFLVNEYYWINYELRITNYELRQEECNDELVKQLRIQVCVSSVISTSLNDLLDIERVGVSI